MIDISSEKLLTPAEIAQHIPRRRAGKKCNVATIHRWFVDGVRGIKLESICVGGTKCSSVAALQRFFDELTAQSEGQPVQQPQRITKARRKQIEAAERRLEKAGV